MAGIYQRAYAQSVGRTTGYAGYRNRLRTRVFAELLRPRHGRGGRLLEIGCNTGALLLRLAGWYREVHGIDQNAEAIAAARRVLEGTTGIILRVGTAVALPYPNDAFDIVCGFEVVEHVADPRRMLAEMARVTKEGGRCVLSFPWEIIRGQAALLDAVVVFHDPRYARKLHLHKLSPRRVRMLATGLPLRVIVSTIRWIPFPSFVMVFEKASSAHGQ